ncbi:hypothetical protein CAOG_07603 [Capsaspora owczarzaki ATCC 30864]|uniref:Uncharacterized protein n=1 Tax=Capsaspora owczarzaki (strain ATCC 30864) TaxID=595528 RepID=A0A0D2X540_CAPO3|nr:hypothetical protein CAOG_07603 [Capsaspora owczarzaki ATCC 30864]KJE97144.1 hypothetical protein CAOG_007603 [Capsaspora owczarzaki ATCC 30864]|eukprot:XP_004343477.1 hypothetical protein CAOG_07603 [Capsaspora owczarzaki ATCC 30864]
MTAPYIGSRISLISNANIRYEGTLYGINTEESTVTLANVRSLGTEGRGIDGKEVPARADVFEYIVFRGSDIKDLHVQSEPPAFVPQAQQPQDPAIVQVTVAAPAPAAAAAAAAVPVAPAAQQPVVAQQQPQQQPQQQQAWGERPPRFNNQHQSNNNYNNNSSYNNNSNYNNRGNHYNNSNRRGGYQNANMHNTATFGGRPNRAPRADDGSVGILGTPNASVAMAPQSFDGDFDFEGSNARLRKEDLQSEFKDKLKLDDGSAPAAASTSGSTPDAAPAVEDDLLAQPRYNPSKSFFDTISCEVSDRQKEATEGRSHRKNWAQERQTNSETFGTNPNAPRRGYGHRGGEGGRGGRGGRGGQHGGYNNNNNSNNNNNYYHNSTGNPNAGGHHNSRRGGRNNYSNSTGVPTAFN